MLFAGTAGKNVSLSKYSWPEIMTIQKWGQSSISAHTDKIFISQRKKPDKEPLFFLLSFSLPLSSISTYCWSPKHHLSPFLPSIHQLDIWTAAELCDLPDTVVLFRRHFVFVCVRVSAHQLTFVNGGIACMSKPHTNFCWVCIAYVAVCHPV